MASGQIDAVLGKPPGFLAWEDHDLSSDEQLLGRFLAGREEGAFEALVVRHGPRVLGVCRQVLGDTQDAEDAFQATFLVLVRRAGAIRKRDSLGHWLHGVAHRIAIRAKARAARRHAYERQVEAMSAVHPGDDMARQDLEPVLHEEVDRLPEKYRRPVVLCYLEGLTNEEAARRLRCPPGTLKGRLARAREILRDRLSRRGLVLGLSVLGMAPLGEATASVPHRLVRATVAAAGGSQPHGGTGVMSARVAEMVDDALRSMSLRRALLPAIVVALTLAAVVALLAIRRPGLPDAPALRFAVAPPAVADGPPGAASLPSPAPAGGCHDPSAMP